MYDATMQLNTKRGIEELKNKIMWTKRRKRWFEVLAKVCFKNSYDIDISLFKIAVWPNVLLTTHLTHNTSFKYFFRFEIDD